jgi:hypothetical protein
MLNPIVDGEPYSYLITTIGRKVNKFRDIKLSKHVCTSSYLKRMIKQEPGEFGI